MDVRLQKMTFSSVYPKLGEFYGILSGNRARLAPWFWWAGEKTTPNKFRFALFMFLYLCDTKHKKITHILCNEIDYDEQFLVFVDGRFGGMIGLDNISASKKNAEVWYWVEKEYESKGIASQSLKIIEDYSLNNKGVNSLYAKIAYDNIRSAAFAKRNNFDVAKIDYNVRTSARNPKITNIVTWEKQLVK
jgi:RimJ/RimL family protein N-acetyltransferase